LLLLRVGAQRPANQVQLHTFIKDNFSKLLQKNVFIRSFR
jgi:hypothetical protein